MAGGGGGDGGGGVREWVRELSCEEEDEDEDDFLLWTFDLDFCVEMVNEMVLIEDERDELMA